MFVIAGWTCSGKDTVAKELIRRGYTKCTTYTTRPMRPGEIDGVTYHFVTEEKFQELKDSGFLAEYASYDTVEGKWWYGTAASDFQDDNDKKFIILNPAGVSQVTNILGSKPKTIYVFANRKTINERLEKRGDKIEEAKRRIEADAADFKGFELIADKIFYNNTGTEISDVADRIDNYIQKG